MAVLSWMVRVIWSAGVDMVGLGGGGGLFWWLLLEERSV